MNRADVYECPSCGGSDFLAVEEGRSRCEYCGRSLVTLQPDAAQTDPVDEAGKTIACYRCRATNDGGALYCGRCGSPLTGLAALVGRLKGSPAAASIVVSVLGAVFFPPLGAVVGLILAHRALGQARRGIGGDEKTARVAVLVGWGGFALSALPLCLIVTWSGAQLGLTLFENVMRELLDILGQVG